MSSGFSLTAMHLIHEEMGTDYLLPQSSLSSQIWVPELGCIDAQPRRFFVEVDHHGDDTEIVYAFLRIRQHFEFAPSSFVLSIQILAYSLTSSLTSAPRATLPTFSILIYITLPQAR